MAATIIANGTITQTADSRRMVFDSDVRLHNDFFFEFAVDGSNTKILQVMGVYPIEVEVGNFNSIIPTFFFQRPGGNTNSSLFATFAPDNVALGAVSEAFSASANDRLAIVRRGDVVSFYKNRIGEMSEPIMTAEASRDSYKLGALQDNSTGSENVAVVVNSCRVLSGPTYTFTADDQVRTLGSTTNPITVRVSQVSLIAGRGPYNEKAL